MGDRAGRARAPGGLIWFIAGYHVIVQQVYRFNLTLRKHDSTCLNRSTLGSCVDDSLLPVTSATPRGSRMSFKAEQVSLITASAVSGIRWRTNHMARLTMRSWPHPAPAPVLPCEVPDACSSDLTDWITHRLSPLSLLPQNDSTCSASSPSIRLDVKAVCNFFKPAARSPGYPSALTALMTYLSWVVSTYVDSLLWHGLGRRSKRRHFEGHSDSFPLSWCRSWFQLNASSRLTIVE